MLEGVSDRANKVYDAMKSAGMVGEEKMANADRITQSCKMPKNMVLAALQELEQKGYAKRKAREKAAGYYILPGK
jgi:predicted transcriptional regulator